MRWQLNDLARLLDERPRDAPLAESGFAAPPSSGDAVPSQDPRRMLQALDALPEVEGGAAVRGEGGEVFALVRIQGLTQAEAAGVVGVSAKTVQRRLIRARLL